MDCLLIDQRLGGFDQVELGFNEKVAVEEARRCLRCDLRLGIASVTLPPEKWVEFNLNNVSSVPDNEGVYQLLNEEKHIIYISGTMNLHQSLQEHLDATEPLTVNTYYFWYEENPMFTARESELVEQFVQEHGTMPEGNQELLDLF